MPMRSYFELVPGVIKKVLCGEALPQGSTDSLPFYIQFLTEIVPFRIPSIDKWYPFLIPSLETLHSFQLQ